MPKIKNTSRKAVTIIGTIERVVQVGTNKQIVNFLFVENPATFVPFLSYFLDLHMKAIEMDWQSLKWFTFGPSRRSENRRNQIRKYYTLKSTYSTHKRHIHQQKWKSRSSESETMLMGPYIHLQTKLICSEETWNVKVESDNRFPISVSNSSDCTVDFLCSVMIHDRCGDYKRRVLSKVSTETTPHLIRNAHVNLSQESTRTPFRVHCWRIIEQFELAYKVSTSPSHLYSGCNCICGEYFAHLTDFNDFWSAVSCEPL